VWVILTLFWCFKKQKKSKNNFKWIPVLNEFWNILYIQNTTEWPQINNMPSKNHVIVLFTSRRETWNEIILLMKAIIRSISNSRESLKNTTEIILLIIFFPRKVICDDGGFWNPISESAPGRTKHSGNPSTAQVK
jgi:hypothetical protein